MSRSSLQTLVCVDGTSVLLEVETPCTAVRCRKNRETLTRFVGDEIFIMFLFSFFTLIRNGEKVVCDSIQP